MNDFRPGFPVPGFASAARQPFNPPASFGAAPARWDRTGVSPALLGVINELANIAVAGADSWTLLHRLTHMAVLVTPAEGASTMILNGDTLDFVHADSPRTASVDRIQDRLQEGPCRTSVETAAPVAVSNLADEHATTAWPHLCTAALTAGLHSTLAVPLLVRDRVWGVLDLYRDHPYTWTVADLLTAQTLAKITAAFLVLTADHSHSHLDDDPTSWGILSPDLKPDDH